MKWTGGSSFSSPVVGPVVGPVFRRVVIAVATLALCQCFAIRSSAQTLSAFLRSVEAEQAKARGSLPEAVAFNHVRQIDGGILNLDSALIAALREAEFRKAGSPDHDGSSTSTAAPDDAEKSGSKAEPDDHPGSAGSTGATSFTQPLPDHSLDQYLREGQKKDSFDWESAFRQSMIFLGIQHAFRLATEEGTRADLKGPFFKDYFKTLRSLRGWGDGDPFIVNYIGHPMMGSVTGFIQIQNDPKGVTEEVSLKRSYWRSRLKAFGWSFAYSTQFEIGLFSEASLGNIGARPYGKAKHPMAYVDIVVTPVVGTGWLVGEDLIDRYVIQRLEDKIGNRTARIAIRGFLNPTRGFANLMRGKWPWYRDNRQ